MKNVESVEKSIQTLLDKYKLSNKINLKIIKQWVYKSKGDSVKEAYHMYQKKWIGYFSKVEDFNELNKILQKFNDAWNYFPHKSLGDKSPNQLVQEEIDQHPELKNNKNKRMPDFIVGGQKMSWDDYWMMIKEMEKLQIPFKNWVEKDLLPKYERFLKASVNSRTMDKHLMVAGFFFDRVRHIGFIKFDQIRKDFIQKEFPRWWQTHVMMSSLKEKEIVSSLKKLFKFISFTYNKEIKKFGF